VINQQVVQPPLVATPPGSTASGTIATGNGLTVTDANGVQRIQIGILPAYTDPTGVASPAELGIRTLDANRNIIFDSVGLTSVMHLLLTGGTIGAFSLTGTTSPIGPILLSGGEQSIITGKIALTRQTTVLLLGICSTYVNTASLTGNLQDPLYFQVDGTSDGSVYGSSPVFATSDTSNQRYLTATILKVRTLSAGTHNVAVMWQSSYGASGTLNQLTSPPGTYLYAFALGL
jgi:hypothetical protein